MDWQPLYNLYITYNNEKTPTIIRPPVCKHLATVAGKNFLLTGKKPQAEPGSGTGKKREEKEAEQKKHKSKSLK